MLSSPGWYWLMQLFRGQIRAIEPRAMFKKLIRLILFCLNPFRVIRAFFYIVFGSLVLVMLTLMMGSYANAFESVPAGTQQQTASNPWASAKWETCIGGSLSQSVSYIIQFTETNGCFKSWVKKPPLVFNTLGTHRFTYNSTNSTVRWVDITVAGSLITSYVCPPSGSPDFTIGPIDKDGQKVCEKPPIECPMGEKKIVDATTGAEKCVPDCPNVAGQSISGATYNSVFAGTTEVSCFGSCSVKSSGTTLCTPASSSCLGDIQFTGQNCPLTFNPDGTTTAPPPPESSDQTNNNQGNLGDAVGDALDNPVSGSTGTADLNEVVDKIAEGTNAIVKASSEQNEQIGKLIQSVGQDIQKTIAETSHSGSAGASIGQLQTANAIKEGNEALGTKLDGIKDALDNLKEDEGSSEPLPPGKTTIDTDPASVHPDANDWESRNYTTVLQQHVASLNETPLFAAVGGFFQVNTTAASCPQFSIDVPAIGGYGGGALVFDAFCDPDLLKILAVIALCIKLAGMYVAFRIAILD